MIAAYVGATASMPTHFDHNTHSHKLSRSTVTVDTHCAVHLRSVHCQQQACHSYNPPSSGTLWEAGPVHSVIPTSSFLFIVTSNRESRSRILMGKSSLFVYARSEVTHLFSPPLSLSAFSSPFIKQRLANSKAHTSRFISANLPCNKFKNRLVNIMPFESTRVCLQPIRGVEGSDYINASCIDGYRSAKDFCFLS